jgi:hypothetical protein
MSRKNKLTFQKPYVLVKRCLRYLIEGGPVAVVLIDVAVLVDAALVALVLPHGALEETLAPLAAHHPIVPSCNIV